MSILTTTVISTELMTVLNSATRTGKSTVNSTVKTRKNVRIKNAVRKTEKSTVQSMVEGEAKITVEYDRVRSSTVE